MRGSQGQTITERASREGSEARERAGGGRLAVELLGMRVRLGRSGEEKFEGEVHDDLVLAVALACWRARKG